MGFRMRKSIRVAPGVRLNVSKRGVEPTTYAAVSLAELYVAAKRYPDVIELTDGIENTDDATALLCVFRGVAFREQGFHDAAHEAFKQALRSRSRDAAIRHLALSERATNYAAQGKKGMARRPGADLG